MDRNQYSNIYGGFPIYNPNYAGVVNPAPTILPTGMVLHPQAGVYPASVMDRDFLVQQRLQQAQTIQAQTLFPVGNINIESLLQDQRKKLERRAANKRAAQQSRERKKSQLEELKLENDRLRRIADMLNSQPELVICIDLDGKITYVSEGTKSFININSNKQNNTNSASSAICPSISSFSPPICLNQLLSTESVGVVMDIVNRLNQLPSISLDYEANVMFASQLVTFHSDFGSSIEGSLRCSRLRRRRSNTTEESVPPFSVVTSNTDKLCKSIATDTQPSKKRVKLNVESDSNLQLLTDCAMERSSHDQSSSATMLTSTESGTGTRSDDEDTSLGTLPEFVCVIRTSEKSCVPVSERNDLFVFSRLSSASMTAHDIQHRRQQMLDHEHFNDPNLSRITGVEVRVEGNGMGSADIVSSLGDGSETAPASSESCTSDRQNTSISDNQSVKSSGSKDSGKSSN